MGLDSATVNILLNTITPDNHEAIADLSKILSVGNGVTKEQIGWFANNKGKRVSIKTTPYIGIVTKLNTATGGFYEGSRYPIYVKIIDGGNNTAAKGMTFEYGIEFLTILEENK
tara:strand:+ start:249 stop:590 length:342 start_codon:yes stop_codon:yes gene_type:complete